jgi:hypothetical protein
MPCGPCSPCSIDPSGILISLQAQQVLLSGVSVGGHSTGGSQGSQTIGSGQGSQTVGFKNGVQSILLTYGLQFCLLLCVSFSILFLNLLHLGQLQVLIVFSLYWTFVSYITLYAYLKFLLLHKILEQKHTIFFLLTNFKKNT